MAAVPTSGGHRADRRLVTLAEQLDYEAARLEGQNEPRRTAYDDLKTRSAPASVAAKKTAVENGRK